MKIVNIHEAKTQLSRLLEEVSRGNEVIIGKYNQPIAKLVPYKQKSKYKIGLFKNSVTINIEQVPEAA